MNTRQELDKLLTDCTKGKNKEMAFELGSCLNSVNREMNGKAKYQLMEKLNVFMDAEDGDRIVQKVCEMQGGFFFRDVYRDGWKDYRIVQSILKEFSELFTEVSDSLEDGIIDKHEERRIDKEWADLQGVLQSFKRAIRRGEFSEKVKSQSDK